LLKTEQIYRTTAACQSDANPDADGVVALLVAGPPWTFELNAS
jgi:hypothetical protein